MKYTLKQNRHRDGDVDAREMSFILAVEHSANMKPPVLDPPPSPPRKATKLFFYFGVNDKPLKYAQNERPAVPMGPSFPRASRTTLCLAWQNSDTTIVSSSSLIHVVAMAMADCPPLKSSGLVELTKRTVPRVQPFL